MEGDTGELVAEIEGLLDAAGAERLMDAVGDTLLADGARDGVRVAVWDLLMVLLWEGGGGALALSASSVVVLPCPLTATARASRSSTIFMMPGWGRRQRAGEEVWVRVFVKLARVVRLLAKVGTLK